MTLGEALQHASDCLARQNFDQAELVAATILSAHPNQPEASLILAITYCSTERVGVGIEILRAAAIAAGDRADLWVNLGRILKGLGHHDDAIAAYGAALAIDPVYAEALVDLRDLYRVMTRLGDSVKLAEQLVELEPQNAERLRELSDLLKMDNRIDEASETYGRALALDPDLRKSFRGETHKAKARRQREGFFERFCQGQGVDIGWGGDLLIEGCRGWDIEDGDSETLEGLADSSVDFAYSSHNLEHVKEVEPALLNWWRVVRPGGYLLLFVPHRDLYEKRTRLPSRWNPDHRRFFLPHNDEPPDTVGVEPLIRRVLPEGEIIYVKACDEGHTITDPNRHSDGEYSVEAVVRKPLA